MSSHITEERSANLIDWSPIVITGNTMRCGPWEIYGFPRGSGPSDAVPRGWHFGAPDSEEVRPQKGVRFCWREYAEGAAHRLFPSN